MAVERERERERERQREVCRQWPHSIKPYRWMAGRQAGREEGMKTGEGWARLFLASVMATH